MFLHGFLHSATDSGSCANGRTRSSTARCPRGGGSAPDEAFLPRAARPAAPGGAPTGTASQPEPGQGAAGGAPPGTAFTRLGSLSGRSEGPQPSWRPTGAAVGPFAPFRLSGTERRDTARGRVGAVVPPGTASGSGAAPGGGAVPSAVPAPPSPSLPFPSHPPPERSARRSRSGTNPAPTDANPCAAARGYFRERHFQSRPRFRCASSRGGEGGAAALRAGVAADGFLAAPSARALLPPSAAGAEITAGLGGIRSVCCRHGRGRFLRPPEAVDGAGGRGRELTPRRLLPPGSGGWRGGRGGGGPVMRRHGAAARARRTSRH